MSRAYKNILKLRNTAYGPERRANLAKETLKDSTPLPMPVEYKDIDEEFKKWVEEELAITFDGKNLPTIALFSNQRFGEYMQTWQSVDNKRNLLLNFKTITRENNPKSGTIVGNIKNIPGERTVLLRRVAARDHAGRKYYIDYRMKQPLAIDLIYTVSVVTNKYSLLNDFNLMINDKFKSINCYIRPNGHFMPMELNDISDESEYSIDNRQFYSQSYNIKVMAYIIKEDDLIVEERPNLLFSGFEGEAKKSSYAEVEELPCRYEKESDYEYLPMSILIHIDPCDTRYEFTTDFNFRISEYSVENIRSFRLFVNDSEVELNDEFTLKEGDRVSVKGLRRMIYTKDAEIKMEGYDPTLTHKKGESVEKQEIEYS